MSVSRVQFLKSLGTSLGGLALGTGIASAAQALVGAQAGVGLATPPVPPASENNNVHFISSGPDDGNRIAITFDDGPTPGVTDVILDELKKRNIHSTFFMIGKQVVAAPELAQRVLAEGHEVGNHTFNHLKLNTLPDRQVDWEIQKTQDTISDVLNYRPSWLRPPYSAFRKNQIGIPQSRDIGVVFWSVDSRDWSQPGKEKMVNTILTHTKPGSIILCHDLHKQTANCIGQILDGLLDRKYEFTSISDFLGLPYQKKLA
jgi:peptidoglycan/xylan/chitin deacetylase (PgdA/CDA1 family)